MENLLKNELNTLILNLTKSTIDLSTIWTQNEERTIFQLSLNDGNADNIKIVLHIAYGNAQWSIIVVFEDGFKFSYKGYALDYPELDNLVEAVYEQRSKFEKYNEIKKLNKDNEKYIDTLSKFNKLLTKKATP